MTIQAIRKQIQAFAFEDLFIDELGWDVLKTSVTVRVDENDITLSPIAQKRGMVALHYRADAIPDGVARRKIEKAVAKQHRENLIVYTDNAQTEQVWQWVRRELGKPLANREKRYSKGQSGEALAQILNGIAFDISEEDALTSVDTTSRVRASFDVERVTRGFYDKFKAQHKVFLEFIEGIPDDDMRRWYASVMMNRLMFIYFVQKKSLLDGNDSYLNDKLAADQGNFYHDFLKLLFFEGLAKKFADRSAAGKSRLGNIPYLNGGLFMPHPIEERYAEAIVIPNEAFEKLFAFFDAYQWHLDDRPLRNDNEINPDVLGYIFEKYINQKQMGAYYTKEDITEYIGKNTIIPFLFDRVQEAVPIAFSGEHTVWDLLRDDPDKYIYPAVRHGVTEPLPDDIQAGVDDVSQRDNWNTPTPDSHGLPTEIWRETVARRQRYDDIRAKIDGGEVTAINDLITLNLDMQQFAQDVINFTDSPDVIRAFWTALNSVSVLDPTCGSGAFLFAALNILEPLYDGCLERMESFVADLRPDDHSTKYSDFKDILARMDAHPNRRYFVFKSIIVNNLYGVDIMDEAVEIAKLRLFLKLVSMVEEKQQIEPLPDIDFNIRAGNTLVGFATKAEFAGRLFAQSVLPRIETLTGTVATFRREQLAGNVSSHNLHTLKAKANAALAEIKDVLDDHLIKDYKQANLEQFRATHKPFHWFVEFHGVMMGGGFDVIIGNPPYVEYSKVRKEYKVLDYKTENAGNLYAFVMERSLKLIHRDGYNGMIVPMSGHSTDRMKPLIDEFYLTAKTLHLMNISADAHPSKLFDGVSFRLAVYLYQPRYSANVIPNIYSTRYTKWYAEARPNLFFDIAYNCISQQPNGAFIPKLSHNMQNSIFHKMQSKKWNLSSYTGNHKAYYHNTPIHWIRSHSYVPFFQSERDGKKASTQLKPLNFPTSQMALAATGILSSSLFFMWYIYSSDCYHLNKREINGFTVELDETLVNTLEPLAKELEADMRAKIKRRVYNYKTSGRVEYDEFYPKLSKHIIDEIDRVLARHYGFTDEELDFILNYDIKYRMGDDLFEED